MQLIIENEYKDLEVGLVTEGAVKSVYVEGVFSTIGEKNRNNRIYPQHIWESNVAAYQNELNNKSVNTLMEMEHPPRTEVNVLEAVGKIEKLDISGKYVLGKAKVLDNPKANIIKNLIEERIKIGVSSRGVGTVGNGGIISNFKLITYDFVTSPSDYGATPSRVYESLVDGILVGKNYMVNESGIIVEVQEEIETAKKLSDFDRKQVEDFILSKFKNLFNTK